MTGGTVRTSTRGGRSVLRSAAAVEAAALRSLTLGASLPLASLANPLERLLGEALDLSGIDQVLGRAPDSTPVRRGAGGRASSGSRSPATSRPTGAPGIGSAAAVAVGGPGAAAPGGIGTAARAAATALQAAAGVGASVADALVAGVAGDGSRAAGQRGAGRPTAPRTGSSRGGSARAGVGQHASGHTASATAPGLDPERVRTGSSTNALRRAARSTDRSTAAPEPAAGPRTQGTQLPPRTTTGATSSATSATSAATGATSSSTSGLGAAASGHAARHAAYPAGVQPTPPARPREFTGGGLAELVARWQDGEPDSLEPPVDTAPVWTPLTSTSFDRERPLRLGDEDRIELALEQILRREVERHGLEGGR